MNKINFIVIKQFQGKKVELHVFTNDGKENVYCISDGGIARKNGYTQLKNLAEQNELSYTSKGLRDLRDKGLLYNMDEQEFNATYEVMKQGNKNQAIYQEERKLEKQLPQVYKALSDFFTLGEISQESIQKDNKNQEIVPKRRDDLDSSKLQEFKTSKEENSEKEREELEESSKKSSVKKKGIAYLLKKIVMIATIIYMAISNVFSGLNSNKNSSRTENRKVTEATINSTKTPSQKTTRKKAGNVNQQTSNNAKRQVPKTATTEDQTTSQQTTKNQEVKDVNYRIMLETLKSKKIERKEKQQKVNSAIEASNLSVVKNENVQDNTRMTGSQYKARLTNFWPDDGYGTGRKTGSGKTIYDFQVNEHGWYTYQGKLVIGTGTPYLLKYGYTQGKGVRLYEYYDELTLTIDGKNYPAIVLDSCGAAMKENRIDLYIVGERYKKDTTIRVIENVSIGKTAGKVKQKVKTR